MTSGITSGAFTMPLKSMRPVNRRYLTRANAASVPSTSELHAVKKAIFSDSHRPPSISPSLASLTYHLSVKPFHKLGTGESLNE